MALHVVSSSGVFLSQNWPLGSDFASNVDWTVCTKGSRSVSLYVTEICVCYA